MKFGNKEKYSRAWWDINYPITKCKCIDNFYIGGEEVEIITTSKAKCNPEDKFNKEFGKALSMVRCRQKANRKIEKLLIQYSNRNVKPKDLKINKGYQKPNSMTATEVCLIASSIGMAVINILREKELI